jgi:hypothetical protein
MLDPNQVDKNVKELLSKRNKWVEGKLYVGCSVEEFSVHMETEHDYLFKNAVTLFKMCVEGTLDMQKLTQMLMLMRQVQSGQHNKETADKIVGKKLADVYVQPLVDKLEKEKKK